MPRKNPLFSSKFAGSDSRVEKLYSYLIDSRHSAGTTEGEKDCQGIVEAARIYFASLKRRSKMVLAGKLDESKKRQRKVQRKHNKAHSRMNACTTSTAITAEEKNEATKILTVDFMSSEETGQETAGSDNERVPPATIFKLRPLPWRSDRANSIIASMDRKAQRRSSDRAKEMCRKRYNGDPSTRQPPPSAPAWAVKELCSCASLCLYVKLENLIWESRSLFVTEGGPTGRTSMVKHAIITNGLPVREPIRRIPHALQETVKLEVKKMLKDGVIRESNSPWSSPIVMIKKKDGSWRFCVDFRKVHSMTQKDAYPLPRIDETLEALTGSQFFTTLDLASGYWQLTDTLC
ncbi:hypothetical protein EMCRGX_G000513 [Ephydatia muelleri]